MTRPEVLFEATKIVCGDRDQQYGSPEDSFETIANFWTNYLTASKHSCTKVTAKDAAVMMALLKIARIAGGQDKPDNWIDLAGYAACGAEVSGSE